MPSPPSPVSINRSGYLVTFQSPSEGLRTYAAADETGLRALILKLTGRDLDTFADGIDGLNQSRKWDTVTPEVAIARGLHIYSTANPM